MNRIERCHILLMVIALNALAFTLNLKEIKLPQVLHIKGLRFFMCNNN